MECPKCRKEMEFLLESDETVIRMTTEQFEEFLKQDNVTIINTAEEIAV